ncbi:MAG: GNAT family N-acetyltransferase [Vagococcus sp.]
MIKKATTLLEFDKMHDLSCYAFNVVHTTQQKEAYLMLCDTIDNYVLMEDANILSQAMSFPFHVRINGVSVPMSGVGNVASYPEARGNGSIRRIFSKMLNDWKNGHVAVSYLAPFSQPFYRQFGYETLFDGQEYKIPLSLFSQLPSVRNGRTERVEWEQQKETIQRLYASSLGTHHGSVEREDWWWNYKVASRLNRKWTIAYDENNHAVGYMWYELGSEDAFIIHELVYLNLFGLKKLLAFVSSHSSSFLDCISTNLGDTTWLDLFMESDEIKVRSYPYMMARIVSFATFMTTTQCMASDVPNIWYLEVMDEMCEWNNGIFELKSQNGRVTCQQVSDSYQDKVAYSGTIQRWTQVLMGRHSLERAIWYEWIDKRMSEADLESQLLTETPVLYDYF